MALTSISDARRAVVLGSATGLCRCGHRAPVASGAAGAVMTCPVGHRTWLASRDIRRAAVRLLTCLPAHAGLRRPLTTDERDRLATCRDALNAAVDALYATHDIRRS